MRVEVDLDKCTGHGICESIADDVFEVQDDGTVLIHENERPDSDRDRMQQAVTQSQLANRIRTLANERLDELLPRGTFDLTQEYGGIVAASVVCELLGLPVDLAPDVLATVNAGSLVFHQPVEPRRPADDAITDTVTSMAS